VQVKKAAGPPVLLDPHLPYLRAAADVERPAQRGQHVAHATGGEDVRLQLRRREVGALLEVPKRAPGRHGVGERHPDAAVDIAAGVEVAAVHLEPALHLIVVDPDHLDAELPGKAARDAHAEQLRRDRRVRQAAALSSRASPS
jgi:hypothetical protein